MALSLRMRHFEHHLASSPLLCSAKLSYSVLLDMLKVLMHSLDSKNNMRARNAELSATPSCLPTVPMQCHLQFCRSLVCGGTVQEAKHQSAVL